MHKYKQAALSIAFLTMILTAGLYSGPIAKPMHRGVANGVDTESIMETFENNDYYAWKRLVRKISKIDALVTKAEFTSFVEARKAARSADYDKAIIIATELETSLKSKLLLA